MVDGNDWQLSGCAPISNPPAPPDRPSRRIAPKVGYPAISRPRSKNHSDALRERCWLPPQFEAVPQRLQVRDFRRHRAVDLA